MEEVLKGINCCVQREKYWCELTADEKVERMRTELKKKENKIDSLQNMLYRLTNLMEVHKHLGDTIVMEISSRNMLSQTCESDKRFVSKEQEAKGEVYF